MLSYFKYYIIKTQQARKSIVLKLCGYAAAFRPDVWGCGPTSGRVLGGVRGVEMQRIGERANRRKLHTYAVCTNTHKTRRPSFTRNCVSRTLPESAIRATAC